MTDLHKLIGNAITLFTKLGYDCRRGEASMSIRLGSFYLFLDFFPLKGEMSVAVEEGPYSNNKGRVMFPNVFRAVRYAYRRLLIEEL
jgi:hypothetical protein